MGIIYCTLNRINGKIYIGKHDDGEDPYYLGSGIYLKRAIKKYGRENFVRFTLAEYTNNDSRYLEEYWITIMQSYKSQRGYNYARKGTGSNGGKEHHQFGKPRTDEEKLKISEGSKGKTPPNKNKQMSNEQREILKQKWSERRPKIDIDKAYELFTKENMTLKQIAEHLHCALMTLKRRLKEEGVKLPRKPPANKGVKMSEETRIKYKNYWEQKKGKH